MEVLVAKSAGFCFGVMRAVDQVYEQINMAEASPIYTYGPIIHNEIVVKDLEEKGVQIVEELEAFGQLEKGTVIIRSHGLSKKEYDFLADSGHHIVDATCPFVKKIHRIVSEKSRQGMQIIIAGNASHPEVVGICGWCEGPVYVVEGLEDFKKLPKSAISNACLVSQTTFHYDKFKILVDFILNMGYDISIVNTICNATQERQLEAAEVAASVDCMLVIGGSHSSNTQKLYEICKRVCNNTHYLQTVADVKAEWFVGAEKVGITAGASTPNNIIEEVQTHVRTEF